MICEGCKELIVTIVNKGWAERVIRASREAGAEGGTILMGRGTGIHEKQSFFGVPIEPEKEIVLIVLDPSQTDRVLMAISDAVELHLPGRGIAFVLPVSRVAGRVHMMRDRGEQEGDGADKS
ncbi:MAG TPA: P-II family nitrogen regulator [Methanoculleus sp.]|mgnify:CR=1 FL=1|nr:P-II family nitrogen regulator [Methanoculleus sp.]